ncbi:MAG: DUF1704 domain-containing protein [Nanoarchaeota archaeon]|nr:DUF1704 domain-containing protein [Nanoarchaeota archaeon]MCG2718094.1 DUF1704 domain-containing protein [Nanoarchaeota archaeon]
MELYDYQRIDKEIAYNYRRILFLPSLQPVNSNREKEKLFKDRTYSPQLKYKAPDKSLVKLRQNLMKIRTDTSVIGQLFNQRRKELLTQIDLLMNVGKPSITKYSMELYGQPSKDTVRKATRLLDLESEKETTIYSKLSVVKKFLDSLLTKGLNWRVIERDMVAAAAFNVSEKILYINTGRKFSDHDLKRLVVHEIGTHVTRAENGRKQKYNLFYLGFPGYAMTEEGLAVYNEDRSGLLSNEVLKKYAGRVVAVDLALKNSFSTVYNYLLEFFDKEDAWTLALRVKRGISNTSRPGAFTKDHIYLSGFYLIKDFVRKGGNLKSLYVGKIGVQHVPYLKKL